MTAEEWLEIIGKRWALAEYLADRRGCTPQQAMAWLDSYDTMALATFRKGNDLPATMRH
jgi:hypothetical protein